MKKILVLIMILITVCSGHDAAKENKRDPSRVVAYNVPFGSEKVDPSPVVAYNVPFGREKDGTTVERIQVAVSRADMEELAAVKVELDAISVELLAAAKVQLDDAKAEIAAAKEKMHGSPSVVTKNVPFGREKDGTTVSVKDEDDTMVAVIGLCVLVFLLFGFASGIDRTRF